MPCAAHMHVFIQGEALFRRLQARLQAHILYFTEAIKKEETLRGRLNYLEHYPIFSVEAPALYLFLKERQLLISQFSYPAVGDSLTTRMVLRACHRQADIDFLLESLRRFYKKAETKA